MHSQQIILFVLGKSVDATPRECGMGHCYRLGRGKRNDRVLLSSNHPVHGRDMYIHSRVRYPIQKRACVFFCIH